MIQITTAAGWVDGAADDQTTTSPSTPPSRRRSPASRHRGPLFPRATAGRLPRTEAESDLRGSGIPRAGSQVRRQRPSMTGSPIGRRSGPCPIPRPDPDAVVFPTRPSTTEDDTLPSWTKLYRAATSSAPSPRAFSNNPTGALVEHGVVATGRYWKWTDGILLMSHRMQLTYSSGVQLSGTWSFPHDFGDSSNAYRGFSHDLDTRTIPTPRHRADHQRQDPGREELFLNTFAQTGVSLIFRNDAARLRQRRDDLGRVLRHGPLGQLRRDATPNVHPHPGAAGLPAARPHGHGGGHNAHRRWRRHRPRNARGGRHSPSRGRRPPLPSRRRSGARAG